MPVLESVTVAEESQEEVILDDKAKFPLRRSIFPRNPPTLRFFAPADEKQVVPLPSSVRCHLKWKLTTITPALVRDTVRRSGFRITSDDSKWCAMWGKHMKFAFFAGMNPFQKVNHFPGSFNLGRKDKLHLNLSRLRKNCSIPLDFVPQTFLLPQEAKAFHKAWKKEGHQHRWIAKPPASSRGTGVFIVSRWGQISHKLQEALVVQRYIHRPLLIRGNKFDLRLYALVTCWDPLKIFVYKQGMLRFATMAYSDSVDSLNNTLMHLTNYSLNKLSSEYSDEQKWTLDEFWAHLRSEMPEVDTALVWTNLVNVIVKTLIAAEGPISRASYTHAPSRYSCFELFGFDVLLDAELHPWLLEVNISPSMRASSANDHAIKEPLIRDTLNISGFRLPPAAYNAQIDPTDYGLQHDDILFMSAGFHRKHMTPAEQQKRDIFMCDELELREGAILENLLPFDISTLIDLEDELERAADTNFERVVPSPDFEHIVPQRYGNKLVNAWESRYGENRAKGRAILQELCRTGAHLVPADGENKRVSAVMDTKSVPWKSNDMTDMVAAAAAEAAATTTTTTAAAPTLPQPSATTTRRFRPLSITRTMMYGGRRRLLMRGLIAPPMRSLRRYDSSDSMASQDSDMQLTTTDHHGAATAAAAADTAANTRRRRSSSSSNTDSVNNNNTNNESVIMNGNGSGGAVHDGGNKMPPSNHSSNSSSSSLDSSTDADTGGASYSSDGGGVVVAATTTTSTTGTGSGSTASMNHCDRRSGRADPNIVIADMVAAISSILHSHQLCPDTTERRSSQSSPKQQPFSPPRR